MAVILKTFLFTDIERSTDLWEADPARARELVGRHDAILRAAIEASRGEVFKTIGDAFCAAFQNAEDALSCAVDAQRRLHSELPELNVRMALESGSAESRDGDFFGPVLNRVSRILGAGHGGQMLAGESFVAVVHDATCFKTLGKYTLRGVERPLEVFQIVDSGLPQEFPKLRIEQLETPNNLPAQLNSIVGREKEIARIAELLGAHRIVTIVGSGGAGKSRLARSVAEQAKARFRGGVWWIDLGPLQDADKLLPRLATELKVPEDMVAASSALDAKPTLLILDNCEHLIEGASAFGAALVGQTTNLSLLCTGRAPLGMTGETPFRLATLDLPKSDAGLGPASESSAVRLFVERARTVQPSFQLSAENVYDVVNICRRLDGIPLALEMAASRLKAMPLAQLAARLDDRFSLLTGSRSAAGRQQTLRATLNWSYSLLTDTERRLFWRLAGFSGGWTFEQVEAIAADESLPQAEILDLLAALVEKSLIQFEPGTARYRTLETIRHYMLEKLAESQETELIRNRQLAYFCGEFNLRWNNLKSSPFRPEMRDWARHEFENLRASFDWALGHSPEQAIDLMCALVYTAPSTLEGQSILSQAENILSHCSMRSQARFLGAKGYMLFGRGEEREARALMTRSLDQFKMLGLHQEANFVRLGVTGAITGQDAERVKAVLQEGIDYAAAHGPKWMLAALYNNLGEIYRMKGDFDTAETHYHQALASLPADVAPSSFLVFNLAVVAARRGRLDEARATLARWLTEDLSRQSFSSHVLLLAAAFVFALEGESLWSARLYGRYRRIQAELGIATQASDLPIEKGVVKRLEASLDASARKEAEGEGAALDLDDLVASTLSLLTQER